MFIHQWIFGLLNLIIIYTDGTDPYYFGTTHLLCMLREKREAPRRAHWEISHRFLYYQGYYFDFLGKFLCLFFLFVCWWVFVPLENVSLIWRHHQYRRAILMAIKQWGFFSVPNLHQRWHEVCIGHLCGPVRDTHTCCRAFRSGAVTTCLNDLGLSRSGINHATAAVSFKC